MGKRQHQKDKLYLTCTEWSTIYGGRRANADQEQAQFRRLPFDHCALSLQPFNHPYCNEQGVIYDLDNIVPFLKRFNVDPITGQKLDAKSLIKLNFHKNNDGQYHCPVLYKVFTENSHIVAIKTTGNVFSYEAVEQLNLKPKHFKDLLTDQPFTKQDIITLLDPRNLDRFNVANFFHVKNQLKWIDEEEDEEDNSNKNLRVINSETRATLDELNKNQETKEATSKQEKVEVAQTKADKFNSANYSTGMVAAGFTSTVMTPETKVQVAVLDDDTVKYMRVKKKGYVRLETNFGPMNLELYCHQVPKACDNFIRLCKNGYYNGTTFHRLIKNFMVQGGDPTGTGKGGQSAFGKPFEDEIKAHLTHSGRGILSMANSGPNTNKSQFFITFRSCNHLDKKHTIFGKLVGGFETLNKIERIKTNEKDKPEEEIRILQAIIFVDPFKEVADEIEQEREKIAKEIADKNKMMNLKKVEFKKPIREGIGSFIDLNQVKNIIDSKDETDPPKKKKLATKGSFGDFSSW